MLFRFLIDGKEYTARMHDIPIVHEIAAACPIDQSWQRSDEFIEKAQTADGFIFGSPVYFSGMNGSLMSFMDRAFFAGPRHPAGNPFAYKPAAAVVSARRAGTTSALDQMNKYFLHGQLPVISSRYWNMVHGNTPEEVMQDEEGLQIMRQLGRNMAWFLKLKEAGQAAGIPLPQQEEKRIATNFIR